jgi:hypothetical protein
MLFASINDIAAVLDDVMDFEASVTTPTLATRLDSIPAAATTTTATTTAATTAAATSTAITTYTPSSDISTIASDPFPLTLSLKTLSHLSREFFANRPVGWLQEAVEIAAREVDPQSQANFLLEISDLFHQQKIFPSGRNGSVRVDPLCKSRQRHPGGSLLRARGQFNALGSISPSDRCFTVSSRSVGLLF